MSGHLPTPQQQDPADVPVDAVSHDEGGLVDGVVDAAQEAGGFVVRLGRAFHSGVSDARDAH